MWFWLWLLAPRNVEVPLGRVADFCPLCRFVKPFEVVRVELAHFSERRGRGMEMFRRCTVCGIELDYQASRYRAVVTVKTADLAALIAETFPNIQEALGPRLQLEQRIREAPESLGAEERVNLIREPMSLVAPSVI